MVSVIDKLKAVVLTVERESQSEILMVDYRTHGNQRRQPKQERKVAFDYVECDIEFQG